MKWYVGSDADAPNWIEAVHGKAAADDPDRFRLLAILDEQHNGKTVVTLRQIHTPERRKIVIGFGAVELGGQTLSKLAAQVENP